MWKKTKGLEGLGADPIKFPVTNAVKYTVTDTDRAPVLEHDLMLGMLGNLIGEEYPCRSLVEPSWRPSSALGHPLWGSPINQRDDWLAIVGAQSKVRPIGGLRLRSKRFAILFILFWFCFCRFSSALGYN